MAAAQWPTHDLWVTAQTSERASEGKNVSLAFCRNFRRDFFSDIGSLKHGTTKYIKLYSMISLKTNKYTIFIVDWVTRISDDCKRTKQPPYQSVKSRWIRKKMHVENDEGNGVTAERNLSVSVLVLCGTTEAKNMCIHRSHTLLFAVERTLIYAANLSRAGSEFV